MAEWAVIVHRVEEDALGRRWGAAVVQGTIHHYVPAPYKYRGWTAKGAKRRAERAIRRIHRIESDRIKRDAIARRVTGYDDKEGGR